MIYIKAFEEINIDKPKVGDYVICKEYIDDRSDEEAANFTANNIGRIIRVSPNSVYKYDVSYDNIPILLTHFFHNVYSEKCRPIQNGEIIYWSEDKDELLTYLVSNKYNL